MSIDNIADHAGGGRAVDVHVPDGEEDANSRARASGVCFFGEDYDAPVGGRNDGSRVFRNGALGIAKERKSDHSESDEDQSGDRPIERDHKQHADYQRRNAEEVALFDHA